MSATCAKITLEQTPIIRVRHKTDKYSAGYQQGDTDDAPIFRVYYVLFGSFFICLHESAFYFWRNQPPQPT